MPSLKLSWVIGYGDDCIGGKKQNPTLQELNEVWSEMQKLSGSMTLEIVGGPDIGPQSLHVEYENGYAIMQLGEDDGEEYNVRSFTNYSPPKEQIIILGNFWDPRMVCQDMNIVKEIIIQFFETGDVAKSLLS